MAKIFENYQELQNSVKKSGVVLLDCFTTWCGPCKMMAPEIETLSKDYEGRALVAKVDVEAVGEAGRDFKITAVPTIIIFKDGVEVAREMGYKPKAALAKTLDKYL